MLDPELTPEEVRVLEEWLRVGRPTEGFPASVFMTEFIAAILAKLCDRYWATLQERPSK